jgi:hypothetical protein
VPSLRLSLGQACMLGTVQLDCHHWEFTNNEDDYLALTTKLAWHIRGGDSRVKG